MPSEVHVVTEPLPGLQIVLSCTQMGKVHGKCHVNAHPVCRHKQTDSDIFIVTHYCSNCTDLNNVHEYKGQVHVVDL